MPKYQGFIYGSYQSQAVTADQERTVNWYVEKMESQGATTEATLYPTPGVSQLSAAVQSPGRAHFAMKGREFAVIGTAFIEIDSVGAQTNRGTVAIDGNPATISSNGDGGGQLFITSGTHGYIFTLATNAFAEVAFLSGKATMGGMLDGFFLALDASTSTFYISNLLDGTTWDPTQFAQRSIMPDPWLSMRVFSRYIALLGEQTSEVWYNTGASPFPFAPHPSGVIRYGIAGAFSSAVLGADLLWVGATREGRANVLRMSGFTPVVISNYPLQNAISDYATISDAQGDSYTDRGHNFYLLTFPTAGVTWVWDSETSLWAERGTWISENNAFTSWRPRWHAFAFNEHRMLDSETGSVYSMDVSFTTDADSRPIRRVRRAPAIMMDMARVFYSRFELDLQPATVIDPTADPQVMMRMSNDGGQTWGTERWRSAGKIGEYGARMQWQRLGSSRRRVFEVSVSDGIQWRLTNAYLDLLPSNELERSQPIQQG